MKTPSPEPAQRPPGRTPALVERLHEDAEDEVQFKPLEWGIIRRLFAYMGAHKTKRNCLIALTLMRAAQLPALVWLASKIIAGPIANRDIDAMTWGIGAYAVLAVLTDGFFHFRQRFALELGESVVNRLRTQVFAHVQRMPMAFFNRVKLGRIIGRMTSDVETVRTAIQDVFFVSIVQIGQMVFAAVVMALTDWKLFLVVVGMAPILWAINRHFRAKLSRNSRAAQESFTRVTATLAESVNGIRVIQGFVRQQTNAGLFRGLLADHSRYNVALARTSAVLIPLLELNSQFFVSILLVLGGWQVLHGDTEVRVLIEFFLFANQFFAPLQVLGNQYNQGLVAMASAERVFKLLDTKPDWEDAPDAVDLEDPRGGKSDEGQVPSSKSEGPRTRFQEDAAAAAPGARVEFRNVSFAYDSGRVVLKDVSFVAEPGQTVALVGHTGSGKSSIINLLAKFYLPTAGEVFVDGRDMRTLTSHSLHAQTGMVQQQSFLFSGTVLENLRLGRPDATEADARMAAKKLDCLEMIEALPDGLHTLVGEKGGGLSAGQRQLICFVRALLADPRILILDEATSAIDAMTEHRLQRALAELVRGRTSFVVAHRLSTIRRADLVLVLEAGRVIERGTHQSLLYQNGRYAELYRRFVQVDERGR